MSLPSDRTKSTTPTAQYEAGFWNPLKHAALALALTLFGILLAGIPHLFHNPGWTLFAVLYFLLMGFCSLMGFSFAVLGVLLCASAIGSIRTIVLVFQDGLVVKQFWSSQFFPWDKMAEIWNRGNHAHLGGSNRWPSSYEIVMNDGRRLNLRYIRGLNALGRTIEKETSRRLLPSTLEQYNQGKTICFGRLSVNNQGVMKGVSTLPWSEFVRCYFDSDGWLTIEWKDRPWQNWIVVSPNKVFNLFLFLRLLWRMSKQRRVCCSTMEAHLQWQCDQHDDPNDCPDCITLFYGGEGRYGIPIHDGGSAYIRIDYCPWCGATLQEFSPPRLPER